MKRSAIFTGVFAVVGLVLLVLVLAGSSANVTFDPLQGQHQGVQVRADATAHGGEHIVFSGNHDLPADPADSPGILTVNADCKANTADCGQLVNAILRQRTTRPLKIMLGEGLATGTRLTFKTSVVLESGVSIEGVNRPMLVFNTQKVPVEVKKNTVLDFKFLFWLKQPSSSNISLRQFDIDMNGCQGANHKAMFIGPAARNFSNIHMSYVNAANGDANIDGIGEDNQQCDLFATEADGAKIYMHNNTADHLMRFFWAKELVANRNASSTIRTLRFYNNTVTNLVKVGIGLDCYCDDVDIADNKFIHHAARARSGNFISTPLRMHAATTQENEVKITNLRVRNNHFEGRQNTPFSTRDRDNGASIDFVAIRATKGFEVADNLMLHSGLAGLSLTSGAEEGVVHGNTIAHTDSLGINLGHPGASSKPHYPTDSVTITNNSLHDIGLDQLNQYTNSMPGISMINAIDSCIVHNSIFRSPSSVGIWAYDGPANYQSEILQNMYIGTNNFADLSAEFVQSAELIYAAGAARLVDASPTGGQNWTARYPGVDADSDGIPAHCFGEVNDTDPCVPLATTTACRES